MVVGDASINNIMSGIENAGGVKQHNHKKKLKQRFDIIKKLGQGTFGKVQLGINKETGQEVAIKTIKKSKIESEADLVRIRREIQIMSSVQHPNIIHIYEVFENREKMVLVMEYAAGGELYDYLSERKVLSEDEARRIFRQIATASYYCHKHKICHRDLKLENILLDENNNAKIADFGLSNVFDDTRLLSTFCGSPLYASPEIVKGTPYQGPEVDCWSLGVLLYTLVYGAMPFDGSNFKRLVKQISQGDYFEPAQPSPASPLIRDMLTVNPKNRAGIEKICNHWWVNETYDDNCLEISEELANQTPVRLDLLLSLAPPPPQLESDKLMVTGDEVAEDIKTDIASGAPARSQSAGSLMELAHPAERRIQDLLIQDKIPNKRKLETTLSTDHANAGADGQKRKEKIVKENTVADISMHGAAIREGDDEGMAEPIPLDKSMTQTLTREMDVEAAEDPSLQGAACAEIVQEAEKSDVKKPVNKIKKTLSTSVGNKILEGIDEIPSQENVADDNGVVDKENAAKSEKQAIETPASNATKDKKKSARKKVLVDRNENKKTPVSPEKVEECVDKDAAKPTERRRSRIFEAAEKFQSMITPTENKPAAVDKPKKILIPGVSVDGFKKEFERKASITSTSPPKIKDAPVKKNIIDDKPQEIDQSEVESQPAPSNADQREKVRNAVGIISSALDKEGTRKSKSRPCCIRKPPVPFGSSGRSASGNIGLLTSPLSPPLGPKPFVKAQFDNKTAEIKQVEEIPEPIPEDKTSSAEITLKSATLPRRKTTKAEIQLNYPMPKPATLEFKTEMAHPVAAAPKTPTQRTEVVVPVQGHPQQVNSNNKSSRKERIIPISFETPGELPADDGSRESVQLPPAKPPVSRPLQTQKSGSISRQSTLESDSESGTTSTGEPIKKSPREYIIPIAVEGGGYVTPRSGSVEPSDSTTSTMTNKSSRSKLGRFRRMGDRDSEDESPYGALYRHSSFGKDSDTEDSRKDAFHRLRTTRPKKTALEHNDSLSSGEEDDDDGFEILTAEHLFSNLLSRVRDLTQKLNVEDGGRPGFPSSRLLSRFDHGTNFWNFQDRLSPLSRHSSLGRSATRERDNPVPWRRSVSRDLASDIESVFKDPKPTLPKGDSNRIKKKENLNLSNLDLKKLNLSEQDALALSYLTPGLSRRIQKHLFAQLTPAEVKKLHRTLSASCNSNETNNDTAALLHSRRSLDRISSASPPSSHTLDNKDTTTDDKHRYRSGLPVKSRDEHRGPHVEDRITTAARSMSLREPKNYPIDNNNKSPDSSLSESTCTDSYSSLSRPSSYAKYSDASTLQNRYLAKFKNDAIKKTDSSKVQLPSPPPPPPTTTTTRRISRFLRPDFFDSPKGGENVIVKEKKERELETQKVLKEIRDKRKFRLNANRRERSISREKSAETPKTDEEKSDPSKFLPSKDDIVKETELLLSNVSNNIKNLENNVKLHDYVNVTGSGGCADDKPNNIHVNKLVPEEGNGEMDDYVEVKGVEINRKNRISKIARPKSYPSEPIKNKVSPEKESKMSRFRKGFTRQSSKQDKNETNQNINEEEKAAGHKNKLLQSIEKKLEKFRSSTSCSNSSSRNKDSSDEKCTKDNKSGVENTIKRLREQSLPRNLEHCTESGLIKRAVSVEDVSNLGKPLQASRKSVTKILGLFKKYEQQESNKVLKKKNVKGENTNAKKKKSENDETTTKNIDGNKIENESIGRLKQTNKIERPKSLLLDRATTKSPSDGGDDDNDGNRNSKLPVSYALKRRSLNLENAAEDGSKSCENSTTDENDKSTRRLHLKLDLCKNAQMKQSDGKVAEQLSPATSSHRNSYAPSTTDDNMSDTWSICSDLHSPLSPTSNGHIVCSGDENESVIDRIRRKSFYTRFNEKKRPRKTSLTRNYKDLDLYKDYKTSTGCDYGSLDRRSSYDYKTPITRHSSTGSYVTPSLHQEVTATPKKDYNIHARSCSLMNDYVNVPNRYQTYSSKIGRPSGFVTSSMYSDSDDNALDDLLTAAKSRKYSSPQIQPSRFRSRTSVSPVNEQCYCNKRPSVSGTSSLVSSPTPELLHE